MYELKSLFDLKERKIIYNAFISCQILIVVQ